MIGNNQTSVKSWEDGKTKSHCLVLFETLKGLVAHRLNEVLLWFSATVRTDYSTLIDPHIY